MNIFPEEWFKRPYSVRLWLVGMKLLRRWWPLKGMWVDLNFTAHGIIIGGTVDSFWRHPWQTRLEWELVDSEDPASAQEWHAYVWPGFVNGRDVSMTVKSKTGHDLVAITEEDEPFLAMAWRDPLASQGQSISDDGSTVYGAGEGYPLYFQSLGVMPPAPGGDSGDPNTNDPSRMRRLLACDIALQTPRVATASDATINPDGSVVLSTRTIVSSLEGHRLVAVSKWSPPAEPSPFDYLMGTAEQPSTDELKIATVWLVSPPNFDMDLPPDSSWTAYVQYFQFWNLNHAAPNPPPFIPDNPITLQTGLAAGTADAIFAALLEPTNDAFSQMTAYLNASTYPGQYWTV